MQFASFTNNAWGIFTWRDFYRGDFYHGGFLPGGFLPGGIFTRGIFTMGDFYQGDFYWVDFYQGDFYRGDFYRIPRIPGGIIKTPQGVGHMWLLFRLNDKLNSANTLVCRSACYMISACKWQVYLLLCCKVDQ